MSLILQEVNDVKLGPQGHKETSLWWGGREEKKRKDREGRVRGWRVISENYDRREERGRMMCLEKEEGLTSQWCHV